MRSTLKFQTQTKSTWLSSLSYVRTAAASVPSTWTEAQCQNTVCCFDPPADCLAVDGCPTSLSHGKETEVAAASLCLRVGCSRGFDAYFSNVVVKSLSELISNRLSLQTGFALQRFN